MIFINIKEPKSSAWKAWRAKCRTATASLIAMVKKGEKPKFTDLYKNSAIKDIWRSLDGPFRGKCAYCEALIVADQHVDLDHYRPKGRVTDSNNKKVIVTDKHGTKVEHPGYYWLAYDWRNLLPSCVLCNQPSTHTVDGKNVGIGKRDRFPVKNDNAMYPNGEHAEEALLINPTISDPEDHLKIDETGIFSPKTDEGRACIDIFGLNVREALVEERKKTYRDINNKFELLIYLLGKGKFEKISQHIQELQEYKEGNKPYSAAAREAINKMGPRLDFK